MSMPTNPLYDALRNWQRVGTEMIGNLRTRVQTIRTNAFKRFAGPTPTGAVGPLMRLRSGGGPLQRISPVQRSNVIPHASHPGQETYDLTFRGPMMVPPFATQRRLGMEGESYDFTM